MKTEDLKNYIFEQFLTEAKMHPLVMRGAQWVADNIGGDAKKLARRMSTGIKRTTTEPTPEHVYNAAQFHFGEILRKNSPSMDRPEVYADMRKQLRAHLGLDGPAPAPTSPDKVNEDLKNMSKKMQKFMLTGLVGAGAGATIGPYFTPPGSSTEQQRMAAGRGSELGTIGGTTVAVGELSADALMASGALGPTLKRRRRLANESAFNFIMGLKRLNEYYNSEHTRIAKMSLPEKKKFYNAIKSEKVSDQEDREERRERLDLIKHVRNSIKNHQDSTTDTETT